MLETTNQLPRHNLDMLSQKGSIELSSPNTERHKSRETNALAERAHIFGSGVSDLGRRNVGEQGRVVRLHRSEKILRVWAHSQPCSIAPRSAPKYKNVGGACKSEVHDDIHSQVRQLEACAAAHVVCNVPHILAHLQERGRWCLTPAIENDTQPCPLWPRRAKQLSRVGFVTEVLPKQTATGRRKKKNTHYRR